MSPTKQTLRALMLKDHRHLETIMEELEVLVAEGHVDKVQTAFSAFCKAMENHFRQEERSIFTPLKNTKALNKVLEQVFNEHQAIRKGMKKAESEFKKTGQLPTSFFLKLLVSHKKWEDEELYPRLDRELDERVKDGIIERINKFASE